MVSTQTQQQLVESYKTKLLKAIHHLEYSYQKILSLPLTQTLDEETLETWESFAVRFARVADLFLMKYLRARLLLEDPGFAGSLRDGLNMGEKLSLIAAADYWLAIRELRNIAAHEYAEDNLIPLFHRLQKEAPMLIELKHHV